MYMFVRSLGVSGFGSLISSLSFMFSGYLIGRSEFLPILYSVVWLPLLFLLLRLSFRRKNLIYVILAGITLSLQILGGFIQIGFYTLIAIFLYFIFEVYLTFGEGKNLYPSAKLLLIFVLILIIGLSLSAIQLLPSYELSRLSGKLGEQGGLSLPIKHLIDLILPDFYGHPVEGNYWGGPRYQLVNIYLGLIPFILILISIARRPEKDSYFFIGLAFLSLLLTLGFNTPLYRLVYRYLPGFSFFRSPIRFASIFTFSATVLVGWGADTSIRKIAVPTINNIGGVEGRIPSPPVRVQKAIGYITIVVVLGVLLIHLGMKPLLTVWRNIYNPSFEELYFTILKYFTIRNSLYLPTIIIVITSISLFLLFGNKLSLGVFKGIILLLIVADLFIFSIKLIPLTEKEVYLEETPSIEFLKSDKEIFRIIEAPLYRRGIIESYIPVSSFGSTSLEDTLKFKDTLSYNIGLSYKIPNLSGYGFFPLVANQKFLSLLYEDFPNSKLLDLANVKYILSFEELNYPDLKSVFPEGEKGPHIYENQDYLPRAFLVPRAELINGEEILNRMKSEDFAPQRYLLLDEDKYRLNDKLVSSPSLFKEGRIPPPKGKIEKVSLLDNRILISAELKEDGFLLINQISYPGWEVYINGKEGRIFTANYLMQAIALDKGKNKVEFIFKSFSFRLGLYIALLAVMFISMTLYYLILPLKPLKNSST